MPITIQPPSSEPPTPGSRKAHQNHLKHYIQAAWGDSPDAVVGLVTVLASADPATSSIQITREYYSNCADPNQSSFCIGSVTKVFHGSLLGFRVNDPTLKGAYQLGSAVNQWLPPKVRHSTGRISTTTLAQLATHSACMDDRTPGQDHGLYNDGGPPSHEQVREWLNDDNWKAGCVGGTVSKYSNWGSITLAFALSQPDGYDYDATLTNYITASDKFNMPNTNTTTGYTVRGYKPNGKKAVEPAHGIQSTMQDMSLFIANYLGGMAWNAFGRAWGGTPSANQSAINAMTKLVTTPPFPNSRIHMGLDWYLSPLRNGATLYEKNGMTGKAGFSAWAGFATLPGQQTENGVYGAGAVVLINKAMKGAAANAHPAFLGRKTVHTIFRFASGAELDEPAEAELDRAASEMTPAPDQQSEDGEA